MEDLIKKAIFILGIIAVLYLVIAFVLPFLWTLAVFLVKFIFYTALVLSIVAALWYGVVFFLRYIEK